MSTPSNTWIFQGKPEIWDVKAGVQLPNIHWVVRQNKDAMQIGDRVYIWIAGSNARIVATATIKSEPELTYDTDEEIKLYPSGPPSKFQGKQVRTVLQVEKLLSPPLLKSKLRANSILRELNIIRNPRGTNFSVTPEQAAELQTLAGNP